MEVGSRKRGRVKMGGMKGAEEGRNEPWAEAGSLRQRCVCKSGNEGIGLHGCVAGMKGDESQR